MYSASSLLPAHLFLSQKCKVPRHLFLSPLHSQFGWLQFLLPPSAGVSHLCPLSLRTKLPSFPHVPSLLSCPIGFCNQTNLQALTKAFLLLHLPALCLCLSPPWTPPALGPLAFSSTPHQWVSLSASRVFSPKHS